MQSEVIGLRFVSGNHSGLNLARYLIGSFDRVGICSDNTSKVDLPVISSRSSPC